MTGYAKESSGSSSTRAVSRSRTPYQQVVGPLRSSCERVRFGTGASPLLGTPGEFPRLALYLVAETRLRLVGPRTLVALVCPGSSEDCWPIRSVRGEYCTPSVGRSAIGGHRLSSEVFGDGLLRRSVFTSDGRVLDTVMSSIQCFLGRTREEPATFALLSTRFSSAKAPLSRFDCFDCFELLSNWEVGPFGKRSHRRLRPRHAVFTTISGYDTRTVLVACSLKRFRGGLTQCPPAAHVRQHANVSPTLSWSRQPGVVLPLFVHGFAVQVRDPRLNVPSRYKHCHAVRRRPGRHAPLLACLVQSA